METTCLVGGGGIVVNIIWIELKPVETVKLFG
jgi:hypothetical protein